MTHFARRAWEYLLQRKEEEMRKAPQPISGTTPLGNIKKPTPPPAPPKPLRDGNEARCGSNPPPSTPRPSVSPPGQGLQDIDYEKLLNRLLLRVNRVTAYHRHGNPIPKRALDDLSELQIEIEDKIND